MNAIIVIVNRRWNSCGNIRDTRRTLVTTLARTPPIVRRVAASSECAQCGIHFDLFYRQTCILCAYTTLLHNSIVERSSLRVLLQSVMSTFTCQYLFRYSSYSVMLMIQLHRLVEQHLKSESIVPFRLTIATISSHPIRNQYRFHMSVSQYQFESQTHSEKVHQLESLL